MNGSSNTNGSSLKAARAGVMRESLLFAGLLLLAVLAGSYQPDPAPVAWHAETLRFSDEDRPENAQGLSAEDN